MPVSSAGPELQARRGIARRLAADVTSALAFLTVLPVPVLDAGTRGLGRAVAWFPLVGALVGALAGGVRAGAEPLLGALPATVLSVAALVVLTGALHQDGLADTADGLGSGKPAEAALAVMRRSDIGPFGVVTLVLVLLLQVVCVDRLVQDGPSGISLLVMSVVVSRAVLPFICATRVPAARNDGLGAAVAASVTPGLLLLSLALTAACLGAVAALPAALAPGNLGGMPGGSTASTLSPAWHVVALVVVPAVVTGLVARRCVRRFGGITGDVLGAAVEITLTTALLVSAFA
jgi:adenosylcobinamide-GDP ribazoletransferase